MGEARTVWGGIVAILWDRSHKVWDKIKADGGLDRRRTRNIDFFRFVLFQIEILDRESQPIHRLCFN